MTTEENKQTNVSQNNVGPARKKKRRKVPGKFRPEVVYGVEELHAAEPMPFWNLVHDAKITTLEEDGLKVSIVNNNSSIEAEVASQELMHQCSKYSAGDTIRVYLEDEIHSEEGSLKSLVASEIKGVELDLLERAGAAQKKNEAISGFVLSEIKGGYSLALFAQSQEQAEGGYGLRAFLPMGRTSLRRDGGLGAHESKLISVKISELDPPRGNIVVSRREILQEAREEKEKEFFSTAKEGDTVRGRVSALMPYGAFVDLGAVDGFLHVSDISWDKKPRLREAVPVGKEIEAKIIGIDQDNKKVKLSIKDINTDPWASIEKTYKPGSEVSGTIVAFADFGAFVRLADGVEGLIHVGEITWNRIKHPSQKFSIGDDVRAAVLRVDKETRRISLSTKAIETSPVERLSGQFPIGTIVKTKVASIHDFGLFVEMDEECNGLVPRSEVSWVRSEDPLEKLFQVGQELEVAVIGYDPRRQRMSCSIKRTIGDPWPDWKNKYRKGTLHKGKVCQVQRAGVLVELEKNLVAFCPRGQLMERESEVGKSLVKVGDAIEIYVTNCDSLRQRVAVSQKAAAESETKKAYEHYLTKQNDRGGERATLGDAFKNRGRNRRR